jgi:uncharacterized membrane protein (DUF106 family)
MPTIKLKAGKILKRCDTVETLIIIAVIIAVIWFLSNKNKINYKDLLKEKESEISSLKKELNKYKKYKSVIEQFEKMNSNVVPFESKAK